MLDEAPHILKCRVTQPVVYDDLGRQVSDIVENWKVVGDCFCHDNSQMKQVSINGELWTYSFHVVYEGEKIALGSRVRCVDSSGNVVGEGDVRKHAMCYSRDLGGRCDLWLE